MFKEFFDRLNKSFNNEETALNVLSRIHVLEIKNPLIGENYAFVSESLNFILINLSKKYDNLIKEFISIIGKLKQERSDKRNILNYFEKINEKTEIIYKEENANNQTHFLNGFIDYLNKGQKEEQKKDYLEAEEILDTIRKNLKELLIDKIDWIKYDWTKFSSLLFLKQNNFI